MLINTHSAVKALIRDGFSERQAESIVEVVSNQNEELTTKKDLELVRKDLGLVKKDLEASMLKLEKRLEARISSVETEISSVESRLEAKISSVESRLEAKISALGSDLLKWMIPLFLTVIGLIITVFFIK